MHAQSRLAFVVALLAALPACAGSSGDDGGADAGPTDRGGVLLDVGALDARDDIPTDAAPTDALTLDALALDAGLAPPDVGAPDGFVDDGGPSDAGAFDGAALDAGSLDAGSPDASSGCLPLVDATRASPTTGVDAVSWARSFAVSGGASITQLAALASGDVVLLGQNSGGIVFGSTALTGAGAFVAALDPGGLPRWAFEVPSGVFVAGVAAAPSGVVLAASFQGSAMLGGVTVTGTAAADAALVHLDVTTGLASWATVLGSGAMIRRGVTDPSGATIALAAFPAGGHLAGTDLSCGTVLVKLGASGAITWARCLSTLPGTGALPVEGLAVDAAGHVWVSGFPDVMMDFGGGVEGFAGVSSYLVELDAAGGWVRTRTFEGAFASSLAVDDGGFVYVHGALPPLAAGAPRRLASELVPACVSDAVHVTKLDAAGQVVWTRGLAASASGVVTVDGSGALAIAGRSSGVVDFGGVSIATGPALFVAKLDASDASLAWVQTFVSPSAAAGGLATSIAADAFGRVFVGGLVLGDTIVGPGLTLTAAGGAAGSDFVAKLGP